MEGEGEMFYKESGHLLYQGTFRKGLFDDGVMFRDRKGGGVLAVFKDGEVLDDKHEEDAKREQTGESNSTDDDFLNVFVRPHRKH